jgi:hypothetical protein
VAVALHLLNNLLAVLLVPTVSLNGAVLIVITNVPFAYKLNFKSSPRKSCCQQRSSQLMIVFR